MNKYMYIYLYLFFLSAPFIYISIYIKIPVCKWCLLNSAYDRVRAYHLLMDSCRALDVRDHAKSSNIGRRTTPNICQKP